MTSDLNHQSSRRFWVERAQNGCEKGTFLVGVCVDRDADPGGRGGGESCVEYEETSPRRYGDSV